VCKGNSGSGRPCACKGNSSMERECAH
jgi:hypothetical protein